MPLEVPLSGTKWGKLSMYYAYIIQSLVDNSYYAGSTSNIKQRVKDHNGGKCKTTSKHKPYKLLWFCVFPNEERAIKFEKYLKSGSEKAFIKKHLI